MRPLTIFLHTVSHNTLVFALQLTLFVLASAFAQFGSGQEQRRAYGGWVRGSEQNVVVRSREVGCAK